MIPLAETMQAFGILYATIRAIRGVRAKAQFVDGAFSVRQQFHGEQGGVAVAAREGESDARTAYPGDRRCDGGGGVGAGFGKCRRDSGGNDDGGYDFFHGI